VPPPYLLIRRPFLLLLFFRNLKKGMTKKKMIPLLFRPFFLYSGPVKDDFFYCFSMCLSRTFPPAPEISIRIALEDPQGLSVHLSFPSLLSFGEPCVTKFSVIS